MPWRSSNAISIPSRSEWLNPAGRLREETALTRLKATLPPGSVAVIYLWSGWPTYGSAVKVTADVPKDATSIPVADASAFAVRCAPRSAAAIMARRSSNEERKCVSRSCAADVASTTFWLSSATLLSASSSDTASSRLCAPSSGVAVSTVVVALSALALAFVWFSGERALRRP